jgi:meiotic recombination protein SPO11
MRPVYKESDSGGIFCMEDCDGTETNGTETAYGMPAFADDDRNIQGNIRGPSVTPSTFTSDARFIIVVEKEGIYSRLVEDRFFDRVPAIIITGKGVPDLATRACVKTLSNALGIPVLGLCDCNPYGLGVLMAYRGVTSGGSIASIDRDLYESDVRWLGLRPSQVGAIKSELPASVFQELGPKDCDKLASLAKHPYIAESDLWLDEIEAMQFKMELEALSWIGVDYLSCQWLESTVVGGDYL